MFLKIDIILACGHRWMQKKLNVLLISFDDAINPWPYLTAFKEPIQIPNLQRIAEQSTLFEAAYSQASVCGPSRASLMTGRSTHQLGVHGNEDDIFKLHDPRIVWPYTLKKHGYYCSSGGKVHHGFIKLDPAVHAILYDDDHKFFARDRNIPLYAETTHFGGVQKGIATVHPEDDEKFHDARAAQSAIDFIENYDADQPFYREVGFYSPHGPFYTPARFKEMYRVPQITRPMAWDEEYEKTEYSETTFPPKYTFAQKNRLWKQSVRNYFSAYSHGDYHLGRVWDALKNSKHADNTLVIFFSDHGFHLGNLDRFMKSTLWEQVASIPLIIHDPRRKDAQSIIDPVGLIDIGPTVLDMLDLPPIDETMGQSLTGLMNGDRNPDRAIPTFFYNDVAIRKGRYRMIRYRDGSTQMYDLENDYWQVRNLGNEHPEYSHMFSALQQTSAAYGFKF